jgi:hypothetical protein
MRVTPTNSATDSKGVGFGLEGNLFAPILLSIFVCVGILFFFFQTGTGADWPVGVRYGIAFSPTVLTALYVIIFFNRRPPRFHHDFWDGLILGGDFYVNHKPSRPHPVVLTKAAIRKNQETTP